jgi:hypothetical protein
MTSPPRLAGRTTSSRRNTRFGLPGTFPSASRAPSPPWSVRRSLNASASRSHAVMASISSPASYGARMLPRSSCRVPKQCVVRLLASSRNSRLSEVVCKNVSGLLMERTPGHDEDSRALSQIKGSVTLEPFFIRGLGPAVRLFRHLVLVLGRPSVLLCNDRARLVCCRHRSPLAKRLARHKDGEVGFLALRFNSGASFVEWCSCLVCGGVRSRTRLRVAKGKKVVPQTCRFLVRGHLAGERRWQNSLSEPDQQEPSEELLSLGARCLRPLA